MKICSVWDFAPGPSALSLLLVLCYRRLLSQGFYAYHLTNCLDLLRVIDIRYVNMYSSVKLLLTRHIAHTTSLFLNIKQNQLSKFNAGILRYFISFVCFSWTKKVTLVTNHRR